MEDLTDRQGEMLRAALNAIATVEPEWLQRWMPEAWYGRYNKAIADYHLPKKKSERIALAELVGQDGMELLKRLWQPQTPTSLRHLEAVVTRQEQDSIFLRIEIVRLCYAERNFLVGCWVSFRQPNLQF